MKEYQVVIVRMTRHVREDEDALTDLLNERSRMGWQPGMCTQDGARMTVIFERDIPHEVSPDVSHDGPRDVAAEPSADVA